MTERNSEPIISVSGLRGIVGESLTPEVAIRYVCAFADTLGEGPIIVARDGRTTGPMLGAAVLSGLCAIGRRVIDADIAATPTVGILVRQHGAAGGIQISASHNPPAYNGLKLFGKEGSILNAVAGEPVTKRYRAGRTAWVGHDRIGEALRCTDTLTEHAALVLATVNVERIRGNRFRVLLDSNHSSSALLGRHLLKELNCDLIHVGAEPDGRFAHPAEPTLENLADVCRQVPEAGASVGFFPDPDGDRLALVEETGCYIGEEYTLALCLDHVLSQRRGAAVANVGTSRMAEDISRRHGVPFFRSRIGEANVVDTMRAHNAVFGGEGNGGVIDPRVGYVRDGFVGMALILDAMAASQTTLSRLVERLPRYHIQKGKLALDRGKLPQAIETLKKLFADARYDESVGMRFDWDDKWLLLHPSNTEPIVRIIAETKARDATEALCREAAEALAAI
ncbi:MAG TPA: phosphoglucosamine mutase [Sedimentisphaerales bacterium]|nr:phosphoglucosamine mutase [Sedimentisphaerales bacterium]